MGLLSQNMEMTTISNVRYNKTSKLCLINIIAILYLMMIIPYGGEAQLSTDSPTVPARCGLKNGLKQADCDELNTRWSTGECQPWNVDNWPRPVVWVGTGCSNWPNPDGGCKLYYSCLEVHCETNCRKLSFCQWSTSSKVCAFKVFTPKPTSASPTPPSLAPTSLPTPPTTLSPVVPSPTFSPFEYEYETVSPNLSPSSKSPTIPPSFTPTSRAPTRIPTFAPSKIPTLPPSFAATNSPSRLATRIPTTNEPTTHAPTRNPVLGSTEPPTFRPSTLSPTPVPSLEASAKPTSQSPTVITRMPSFSPTVLPTTGFPTQIPTRSPSTPVPSSHPSPPTPPTLRPSFRATNESSEGLGLLASSCDTTCAALATTFTVILALFAVYGCLAFGLCVAGGLGGAILLNKTAAKKQPSPPPPKAAVVPPPTPPPMAATPAADQAGEVPFATVLPGQNLSSAAAAAGGLTGAGLISGREALDNAKRRAAELESQLDKLGRENEQLEETNRKLQEEVSYLAGLSMEMN